MTTKKEFNEKYNMEWYCGVEITDSGIPLLEDVLTWGRRYYLLNEDGTSKKKVGHYLDNCLIMTSPHDAKKILRCQKNTRRKSEREIPEKREYTAHAKKQMFLRGINEITVMNTLKFGKLIHYKDRGGNLRDAYLLDNISIGATMSDNEEETLVIVTVMRLSPISELNFINECRGLKERLGEDYRYSIAETPIRLAGRDGISLCDGDKEWEGRINFFENFQPERDKQYYSIFRIRVDDERYREIKTMNKIDKLQEELDLFRRLGFEGDCDISFEEGGNREIRIAWPMKNYDLDCVWAWGRK